MDVEKTLQKIADSQLRAEQRAARADERADRADEHSAERHKRAMERADKFDKQLKVTAELLRAGIKWAATEHKKQKERSKEIDFKLNALIDSQDRADERVRKLEEKWDRWLDELSKRRTNGHS